MTYIIAGIAVLILFVVLVLGACRAAREGDEAEFREYERRLMRKMIDRGAK